MKYVIVLFLLFFAREHVPAQVTYLITGSYTEGQPGNGIHVFRFNPKSGALKPVSRISNITNSSFLNISHDGRFVYACTDTKLQGREGNVTAFVFDSINGKLTILNKQPAGGENPVYVTVHPGNRLVVNANYTSGNLSAFRYATDGRLAAYAQLLSFTGSSSNIGRQDKPHLHAAVFSPQSDYLFVPDLGADRIRVFRVDTGRTQPLLADDARTIKTVPGSGPRHFVFHPSGKFAYCIEELSGTVSAYRYADGKLDSVQRIFAYSEKLDAYSSADIHISPDGRFLYASNRMDMENTIAIFAIDSTTGILQLRGHQSTLGDHPRNFTLDPSGKFVLVANQVSGNIVVFRRDEKTGLLRPTRQRASVPHVSCLQMRTYNTGRQQ